LAADRADLGPEFRRWLREFVPTLTQLEPSEPLQP
jgi:hypothetical protein